jgi:diaminobutyrate-2-oxoglutarate transaminase
MLEIMRRDNIFEHVANEGRYITDKLTFVKKDVPIIGDVRGLGLMLGVEIVDPATGKSAPALAAQIQQHLLARGLLMELGGRQDCVIRFLPPLNVDRATIDVALEILVDSMRAAWAAESSPRASP